jgi:YD repeat-containing protein
MMTEQVASETKYRYVYDANDERVAIYTPSVKTWQFTLRDPAHNVIREFNRVDPDGRCGESGSVIGSDNRARNNQRRKRYHSPCRHPAAELQLRDSRLERKLFQMPTAARQFELMEQMERLLRMLIMVTIMVPAIRTFTIGIGVRRHRANLGELRKPVRSNRVLWIGRGRPSERLSVR